MFRWTQELTDDLYRLHGQGLSAEDIAERLGVDVGAVKNKLKNDKQRKKADVVPKANPVNADALYIGQLQELLTEKTQEAEELSAQIAELKSVSACYEAEIGELRKENASLKGQLEHGMKLMRHMQQPVCEPLEEIYALADCLSVIEVKELLCPDSAKLLVSKIMDTCDAALERLKQEHLGIEMNPSTADAVPLPLGKGGKEEAPQLSEAAAEPEEFMNFNHPHCTTEGGKCQDEI